MKTDLKKVVSVTLLLSLVFTLSGCGEKKKYDEAMSLYNSGDFRAAANIFEELGTYEDSETMLQSCEYELTVDRQFIWALSQGIHEGFTLATKNVQEAETVTVDGKELTVGNDYPEETYYEAELDGLVEFKTATFENQELQEKALKYIAALEEGIEAQKYVDVDYSKYTEMTNEVYAVRATLLSDFYNNYDMKVSDIDMDSLQSFFDSADAIQEQQDKDNEIKELFINNFKYTAELVENEFGYYNYDVKYEFANDSSYSIEDLYVEFYYFNSDGSKTDDSCGFLEDVQPGKTLMGESPLYLTSSDTYPTGTVKIGRLSFNVDGETYSDVQSWFE